jgi:isopentenyl phosphate kinase
MGRTVAAMRELGDHLAAVFLDAGVPLVLLQTSSCVRIQAGCVTFTDKEIIETILESGGFPMLGGDVVIARGHTQVVSADALAVALTHVFKKSRLLFASDTNGVFEFFPPRPGERPIVRMDHAELARFLREQRASRATHTDTTGGMVGKLQQLITSQNISITIFNGAVDGNFLRVLERKKVGTYIEL